MAGAADTDPKLDPRWTDSEARLVQLIRDEIVAASGQRITFARFMERALSEPGLGYYAQSELRPTRTGDFLTAPELHPFFGRCLGRFLSGMWEAAGSPVRFRVREYGAGRGTLRDTVQSGLRDDVSRLAEALEWQALDLPGRGDAEDDAPVDLVLANEYLDAQPVHRVVRDREQLKEAYVGWREGWFEEILDEPSSPELGALLTASGIELAQSQRADLCLASPRWLADVARTTQFVLVIDYGHDASVLYGPQRMAGSLLTYRAHTVSDDPFSAVGHSDITAHVDFTALERAAASADMELLGSTSQARFLADLGLGQMLSELGQQPQTEASEYVAARSAVARLTDPRHLGAFQVLAWAQSGAQSGGDHRIPGFALAP